MAEMLGHARLERPRSATPGSASTGCGRCTPAATPPPRLNVAMAAEICRLPSAARDQATAELMGPDDRATGSTLVNVTLVVQLPEELARRVEAVAASRPQTPEQVALGSYRSAPARSPTAELLGGRDLRADPWRGPGRRADSRAFLAGKTARDIYPACPPVIIVDTGVFLAVADASDTDHDRCDELLAAQPGEMAVPTPVLVETSWLIEKTVSAPPPRWRSCAHSPPTSSPESISSTQTGTGCVELVEGYSDLGLGLVDASVIAVAERLEIDTHRNTEPPRTAPWCDPGMQRPSRSCRDE